MTSDNTKTNENQNNPLGYENEAHLLTTFAIPCIISMLVTALYNIVDQIFIGHGVGMLGNAATNIAFPLSTACTAISLLLGIGSATSFSLKLGAGDEKKSAEADWKQYRRQKLKFTYKEQREFETIDDDIAALEELLEKLDKDMEANATNSVKLREIMEQKEKTQADLDEKMDRWVYLNDLAERIEAQKSEK